MKRNIPWWIIVAVFFFPAGCSQSPSSKEPAPGPSATNSTSAGDNAGTAAATLEAPAAALAQFLEALRTGNDEQAGAMLTQVARQKAAALNLNITPSASDTAKFSIGQVKYVNQDGAQVSMTWTDLDADGQQQTDEAVWVLRKETEGWRVAGVASVIFPNEPPVLLNFEDPEELQQKREQVRQEIKRRSEKENLQAQESEDHGGALRR